MFDVTSRQTEEEWNTNVFCSKNTSIKFGFVLRNICNCSKNVFILLKSESQNSRFIVRNIEKKKNNVSRRIFEKKIFGRIC